MTREEKIEIMFESILSEIENIGKNISGGDHGKVQNHFSALNQKLDGFIKKLSSVKLNIQQPDLSPLDKKLDIIIDGLYDNSKLIPFNQVVGHFTGNLNVFTIYQKLVYSFVVFVFQKFSFSIRLMSS